MKNLARLGLVAAISLLAAGVGASCSAGGGGRDASSSGHGSGGASGGETSSAAGLGGSFTTSSAAGDAGTGCQHVDVTFQPQTPTVLLVVDRSGSMFDSGFWDPLKTAALDVVMKEQAKVRFGLLTFTGVAPAQCPLLTQTGIDLNNYPTIQSAYDAASVKPAGKLETPTSQVFESTVIPTLLADKEPGSKYIVFVTDGEPDFCDDVNPICARDAVVGAVQSAYKQGITTLVFGLGTDTHKQHLQDVANAGSGQPVLDPGPLYGCPNGNPAPPKGTYAQAGGSAKYYSPNNPTDSAELENELNAAISGAKSCTFDLQGQIQVDVSQASAGTVIIDGVSIPYDMMNGWYMQSSTVLVLVGDACAALKSAKQGISFDFPCDIITPK